MILVVDFGSQTANLISRRLRQLGISNKFITPEETITEIKKETPKGIIFSGGPSSVYDTGAPTIDPAVFSYNIPVLGICYGFQIMAKLLGGEVVPGKKEYGPSDVTLSDPKHPLTLGIPENVTVWMSHGDEVVRVPQGFTTIGSTTTVPFAVSSDQEKQFYGVLFHPEVEHTQFGTKLLENFAAMCGENVQHHVIDPTAMEQTIRERVGDAVVIGAVSGGVDSTVAGALTAKAIGKQFIPIYVDNGLMREGTTEHVKKIFTRFGISPIVVDAEEEMIGKLQSVTDPEEKRKIIGNFYVELFEREMQKLLDKGLPVKFLLQGTIYSDVIESQGTKHASKIKSHHNVGGLPDKMKLELLEPVRELYKDEVRELGKLLGLPDEFVYKQPFPGPGYAIRIRGEVTKDRLDKQRKADRIVLEEIEHAGLLREVFISFPVLTGAQSTAVKGDGRFFGEVIALRVVESKDVMTSTWARLPYEILQKISSRIVNEVPEVSRVVYDITTKPPATMEWE